MITRRKSPLFFAAGAAIVSVLLLVRMVLNQEPPPSGKALILIYVISGSGVVAVLLVVGAAMLGWFPYPATRRRQIVDLAHESSFAFRPFWQNLAHSVARRPAVGFIGFVVAAALTMIVLAFWPGHSTTTEKAGLGLGIAGLLFGMLGYHVALRVETSIRDSITDFREFLREVSQILESEILCEHRRIKKFPPASETESIPTAIPDLVMLLWFPYYGLTKDFNRIGLVVNEQLRHVQELACRTYLISAKAPLALMEHFDKQYAPAGKRYDPATLKRIADAVRNSGHSEWEAKIEDAVNQAPKFDRSDPKVERVLDCVEALKDLIYPSAKRYWTVITADNEQLMQGLIQLIWTPKKAAVVFMPPEKVITQAIVSSPNEPSAIAQQSQADSGATVEPSIRTLPSDANELLSGVPKAGDRQPYKCSGFVTEDPFMISMIRDLVEIRFGV